MKKIGIGLVVLVLLLVGYAWMQPTEFKVSRTTVIEKPIDQLFVIVGDFKSWPMWSPWMKRDPNMELAITPNSFGIGARQAWKSKTQGEGYQVVREVELNKRIRSELHFTAPNKSEAMSEFQFKSIDANQTELTWVLEASNKSLIEKFFFGAMGVAGMIGKDFEEGFDHLKKLQATTVPKPAAKSTKK